MSIGSLRRRLLHFDRLQLAMQWSDVWDAVFVDVRQRHGVPFSKQHRCVRLLHRLGRDAMRYGMWLRKHKRDGNVSVQQRDMRVQTKLRRAELLHTLPIHREWNL